MLWHTLEAGEVCAHFTVDSARGLESAEASRRLTVQGNNELIESGGNVLKFETVDS